MAALHSTSVGQPCPSVSPIAQQCSADPLLVLLRGNAETDISYLLTHLL